MMWEAAIDGRGRRFCEDRGVKNHIDER